METELQLQLQKNPFEMQDMHGLLYSIVFAFIKAIDERTPYNANHTMQVAEYLKKLIAFLNRQYDKLGEGIHFSAREKEQILLAAYLHDVGKLVVPLEVMNKATRLGEGGLEQIHNRFLLLAAYLDIDYLEGRLDKLSWQCERADLQELEGFIMKADKQQELSDMELQYFAEMGKRVYQHKDGRQIPWLQQQELEDLQIARGTLNEEERRKMEYHALATEKILMEIQFGAYYDKVLEIACRHHEFLDGSGYPHGLRGEQIPLGARMLTIVDIYDSLVSMDRPYKVPLDTEQAQRILLEMAEKGKLDPFLTEAFCQCMKEAL